MSYCEFAKVYDRLQSDVDYAKRTEFLLSLFEKYDRRPTLLLDMACGTGGFSLEFMNRKIDVIGVDISPEMLMVAREKFEAENKSALLLCQAASQLDLYGTVDGAICCLDSLNHITDERELQLSLDRISLFLEPGRLFIFDVNTINKHKNILADNTFVIDEEDIYCVWRNTLRENETVDICLDFFVKTQKGTYQRSHEEFSERAYSTDFLKTCCDKAGLEVVAVLSDMSYVDANDQDERIFFVTRKR